MNLKTRNLLVVDGGDNLTTLTCDDDDRITNWQSDAANINPAFDLDGNMTTG